MDRPDADILGQPDSLVPPVPVQKSFLASTGQTAVTLLALWVVYAFGRKLWVRVLRWKENTHKLAMRRKHGIPDSDLRPFNVAYADAKAQQEQGAASSKPSMRPRPRAPDHSDTLPDSNLRQRSAAQQTPARYPTVPVPGAFSSTYASAIPNHRHETSVEPRHATRHSEANHASSADHAPSSSRAHSQTGYNHNRADSNQEDLHRGLVDEFEQPDDHTTGLGGDDLIDGDEDSEFQDEIQPPIRGSKRMFGEDDNEDTATRKARGKRARKVSLEKQRAVDEDMDVDDEDEQMDEITDLMSPANRGKKRDRDEAASTFGGDDSEPELEDNATLRRRQRKRRTVAKRQSEASYLRGKKRDREGDENISDEEKSDTSPVQKKKRGKRPALVDQQNKEADISMDESITSKSSRTKRNIGDEWESNGIRWKIGPNGQRLRQALVKKAKQKFTMPKDSQHPDRNANLQVCIECWMTEAEYQDAKANNMLAWQDSPKKDERDLSIDTDSVPFPSSALGKSLLWSASATSSPGASPASSFAHDFPSRTRSFPRHSIASSVGVPFNPFIDSSSQSVRRIASSSRATSLKSEPSAGSVVAVTNGSPRPTKTFSKWEKQELEASAMMKIRSANKKKEEERDAKLRAEREKAEKEKQERERLEREKAERIAKEKEEAERKAKEAAAPKITVTAPSSESVTQPTAPPSAPPAAPPSLFGSKPPSAPTPTPAAAAPVPNFFGNAAQLPSAPSTAPLAPATTGPPKPLFSFGPAPAASTPATVTPSAQPPKEATQPFGLFGSSPITSSQSNPLLARLGPPASEPAKQGDGSKSTPDSKPQSFFHPAGTGPSLTSGATNGVNAATTPKFSFGFPSAGSSASGTTSSSNSLSSALTAPSTGATSDASKSSPFAFKVPAAPSTTSTPAAAPSATPSTTAPASTTPKFSFGPPSSNTGSKPPSLFGGAGVTPAFESTTNPASSNSTSATNTAEKPSSTTTTGAFGATTPSAGGLFSGASAGAGSTGSVFGAMSTPGSTTTGDNKSSVFGSTSSSGAGIFGAGASGGAKPASVFGSTGAANTSSPSPFGATGAGTTPASNPFAAKPAPFTFGGPTTSTPSTTTGTKSTNGTSGSTFSFGAPTTSSNTTSGATTSTPFSFGAPSNSSTTTSSTPAKPAANPFAPSTPATGAASTTPASTPAGGFSFNFAKTSTTPAASPFPASNAPNSLFGGATSTQSTGAPSIFGAKK